MARNRPPETVAEQLMKLGVLAFYACLDKVEVYFSCWYDARVSHEENWKRAIAAIESGWTPEKELNGRKQHSGDGADSVSAAADKPNLAGLAAQLQRKWRLGA